MPNFLEKVFARILGDEKNTEIIKSAFDRACQEWEENFDPAKDPKPSLKNLTLPELVVGEEYALSYRGYIDGVEVFYGRERKPFVRLDGILREKDELSAVITVNGLDRRFFAKNITWIVSKKEQEVLFAWQDRQTKIIKEIAALNETEMKLRRR